MSRKLIAILILLMSISLLGIIGVQILWIRNAIQIEERKFDSNVRKVLNRVVSELEKEEAILIIKEGLDKTQFPNDTTHGVVQELSQFISERTTPNHQILITTRDTHKVKGGQTISAKQQLTVTTPKIQIRRLPANKNILNSTQNIDIKIDTPDTIIQFHKILESKENQIKDVFNKVIWEYEIKDKKIEDRVSKSEISDILKNTLPDFGIQTPYEFGVFNSGSGKLFFSTNPKESEILINSPYQVKLFPGDIWAQQNFLTMYFPQRVNFVYRSLIPLLILSSLFTLFILATFILTIILILRQKRISDIKSDFINNITHEFKTPIATIGLAADSIVNPKIIGNPDRIRYLTSLIKDENYRMNKQVENILQLSLFDKRELEFNPQLVHVNEIMQKAAEHMQLQIDECEGQLTCKWEAINDLARIDEVHFINVLFNLIDNAIKYSLTKPKIELGTKNENNDLHIWIQDQGIGMTRKTAKKIFSKFYRAETGNIHRVKGFGLGLSYVKLVVDRHKGSIDVKSKPNQGTRINITIPTEN